MLKIEILFNVTPFDARIPNRKARMNEQCTKNEINSLESLTGILR